MNRSATVIIESLSSTDITNYVSDIWMDIFIPCLTKTECIHCKKNVFPYLHSFMKESLMTLIFFVKVNSINY